LTHDNRFVSNDEFGDLVMTERTAATEKSALGRRTDLGLLDGFAGVLVDDGGAVGVFERLDGLDGVFNDSGLVASNTIGLVCIELDLDLRWFSSWNSGDRSDGFSGFSLLFLFWWRSTCWSSNSINNSNSSRRIIGEFALLDDLLWFFDNRHFFFEGETNSVYNRVGLDNSQSNSSPGRSSDGPDVGNVNSPVSPWLNRVVPKGPGSAS